MKKSGSSLAALPREQYPRHIGIIMDGNGRWAKKRGLPRTAGHKAGADVFRDVALYLNELGIGYLTVYAFSCENWKRPPKEVDAIMDLMRDFLKRAHEYKSENIKTRFIGDRSILAPDIQALMKESEEGSEDATGMVLNVAVNYSGRQEILRGIRRLVSDVQAGRLAPGTLDEERFGHYLDTASQPDPDLIIRPSAEQRISNFLVWQAAYAEYLFIEKLWPDIRKKDIDEAIIEFARRNRRFGGL